MSAKVSLARQVAFDIFAAVEGQDMKLDDIRNQLFHEYRAELTRLDRNFITEIVLGTLRWRGKLLWILQNTSSRDLKSTSKYVRTALLCGTYQVYYMDRVPDRAAVNESVEYVRLRGEANACPFVNGIMRQIARKAQYFPKPDKVAKPAEYLSIQYAHPQWLVERWLKRFKFDRVEKMLISNNKVPPHSARINSTRYGLHESDKLQTILLREERTHSERRPLRSTLRLRESPDTGPDSLFQKGEYTIQDESAQLIALLVEPKAGETVIDACVGKGGKLSHLYELSQGQAKLIAVEANPLQAELGKQTMARMGFDSYEMHIGSFMSYKPEGKCHKILLDVPCSGFGILRRHPEGKWQKTHEIIGRMVAIQQEFLLHAWELLDVGDEIIYSVCSFESEETEDQLEFMQKRFGDSLEVVSPLPRLPDYYKRYVTRDQILLIYAGNSDDLDGFGAFIIKKTKK